MSEETNTREQLEADANLLRERLAKNLESLDHRRHEAFDVKAQVVKHPFPLMVIGATSLIAASGIGGLIAYRAHSHKRDGWDKFVSGVAALSQAVRHPDEVNQTHSESVGKEIVRGVLVSIGTFAASQLAKRALHKFMPELWQEPRPVPVVPAK